MPDRRRHRGQDPADAALFAASAVGTLRVAVGELSWLLGRGYTQSAALKLVGDRHQLHARQRLAVLRSAVADGDRARRAERQVAVDALAGRAVAIDGFNCLITVEAALAGGLLLRGRDGVLRDLAGVHGSYRRVAETEPAIRAIGARLGGVAAARVYLDRPISNSGRLKQAMEAIARERGWPWEIRLADNPDRAILADVDHVAASSDGVILDHATAWCALADAVVAAAAPAAWVIDLGAAQ